MTRTGRFTPALRDGRDPRTDSRTIFKAALVDHLGIPKSILDDKIFPGSESEKSIAGLIRA